jgi:rhodanese-related sulfurtransferase
MTSAPSALTHADVAALLETTSEAWTYLDVRTPQEFATGHVPGAFNIPYQHGDVAGLHANPDFLDVVTRTFPRDARLILGCRSGARAASAEQELRAAGYLHTRVHLGSLVGARDPFGRKQPGWMEDGYPIDTTPRPGHTYDALQSAQPHGNSDTRRQ